MTEPGVGQTSAAATVSQSCAEGALNAATRSRPVARKVWTARTGPISGGFAFGAATDFAVLGGLAAILLAIGAYLFSKIEV
jgi:hypothetical protein